jgi:RHS repeat-associated protein
VSGRSFVYNLRFPGQYYDAETGLNYNMRRDYDSTVGRYIESDPIGLRGGVNTYAYAGDSPTGRIDPNGLTSFEMFPPDKLPMVRAAVEEAKTRLKSCNTETCGRTRAELEEIIAKLEAATLVYDESTPHCAYASRAPLFFVNTISVGPAAFSWGKCCDLSSTLAHEANHLRNPWPSGSEPSSRSLESKCFNCPRSVQ